MRSRWTEDEAAKTGVASSIASGLEDVRATLVDERGRDAVRKLTTPPSCRFARQPGLACPLLPIEDV